MRHWLRCAVMVIVLCGAARVVAAAPVNLAWDYTQGTDLAVGFNLYRAPGTCAGIFVKLNTTGVIPVTTNAYSDTTAASGATFCWKVTAVNSTGVEAVDTQTGQVVYAVPLPPILNPPTHLRVLP